LKFKADFHSTMSACRYELGGGFNPQPHDNSHPVLCMFSSIDFTHSFTYLIQFDFSTSVPSCALWTCPLTHSCGPITWLSRRFRCWRHRTFLVSHVACENNCFYEPSRLLLMYKTAMLETMSTGVGRKCQAAVCQWT